MITYFLISRPDLRTNLTKELEDVDLDTAPWLTLEKLPYLSAVIAEGLRLSYGISSRTPRIAPQEHLVYRGQGKSREDVEIMIPKGTAIGSKHNKFVLCYTEPTEL